jgi:hypothetical protein
MLKWSASLACLAGIFAISTSLHAQATPTAYRGGGDIQAGAALTFINGDYTYSTKSANIGGVSVYADYGITHVFGVEAEAHFGTIITPQDLSEKSYMIGPTATYHRGKLGVYGKLMFGRASITDQTFGQYYKPDYFGAGMSYNAYAFGGGVTYRFKHHYNAFVDLEDQKWPNFEPHTLSPIVMSVGVKYVIR